MHTIVPSTRHAPTPSLHGVSSPQPSSVWPSQSSSTPLHTSTRVAPSSRHTVPVAASGSHTRTPVAQTSSSGPSQAAPRKCGAPKKPSSVDVSQSSSRPLQSSTLVALRSVQVVPSPLPLHANTPSSQSSSSGPSQAAPRKCGDPKKPSSAVPSQSSSRVLQVSPASTSDAHTVVVPPGAHAIKSLKHRSVPWLYTSPAWQTSPMCSKPLSGSPSQSLSAPRSSQRSTRPTAEISGALHASPPFGVQAKTPAERHSPSPMAHARPVWKPSSVKPSQSLSKWSHDSAVAFSSLGSQRAA